MNSDTSQVSLGVNGKPKGETRIWHEQLEQRENPDQEWRPAVRHSDVRERLLEEAAIKGSYYYPRQKGNDHLDETSYLHKDRCWGYERSQRPDLLFQIHKNTEKDQVETKIMKLDGRVLLDQDDHEIIDWPHLPATISSRVTGQELEYFRRQNLRIEYLDIIARMPRTQTGNKRYGRPPPPTNSLNMRALRFRLRAGCISWHARQGTDKTAEAMINLLGHACRELNSSRPFGRDLTNDEIEVVKQPNRGAYPNRRRNEYKNDPNGNASAKQSNHTPTHARSANLSSGILASTGEYVRYSIENEGGASNGDSDEIMGGVDEPENERSSDPDEIMEDDDEDDEDEDDSDDEDEDEDANDENEDDEEHDEDEGDEDGNDGEEVRKYEESKDGEDNYEAMDLDEPYQQNPASTFNLSTNLPMEPIAGLEHFSRAAPLLHGSSSLATIQSRARYMEGDERLIFHNLNTSTAAQQKQRFRQYNGTGGAGGGNDEDDLRTDPTIFHERPQGSAHSLREHQHHGPHGARRQAHEGSGSVNPMVLDPRLRTPHRPARPLAVNSSNQPQVPRQAQAQRQAQGHGSSSRFTQRP